jgi:hypothetical protein
MEGWYRYIKGKLFFHALEFPIFEKQAFSQKHRHLFHSDQKTRISKYRDQKTPIISSAPHNSLNILVPSAPKFVDHIQTERTGSFWTGRSTFSPWHVPSVP